MKLTEGLDYHDMKGQIDPVVTVDEYAAKMGEDSDVVTITFKTNSKLAAQDLNSWIEGGYKFILDSSVSDGEIQAGKWLVFVEMPRRSNVPEHIITILEDLQTLTDMKLTDYTIVVDEEEYDADIDTLKQVIILSPLKYKKEKGDSDEELNEMRQRAGLEYKNQYTIDDEIRKYITNAGL